MSVCERNRERRKQVYNPVGIMQTAGKRLADSRITLAIVAKRTAGRGRERKRESGSRTFRPISWVWSYFRATKVAYSVWILKTQKSRGWKFGLTSKIVPRVDSKMDFHVSGMVFISVGFVPKGNWNHETTYHGQRDDVIKLSRFQYLESK